MSRDEETLKLWPHDVLLDNDNWHQWLILYEELCADSGIPGKDILNNQRTVYRKPHYQDSLDPDDLTCTSFRYDHLIEETIEAHTDSKNVQTPKKQSTRNKNNAPSPGTVIKATASEGTKTYTISTQLSDTGKTQYLSDETTIDKKQTKYNDHADALIKKTVASLGPTTRASAIMEPDWKSSRIKSDSFAIFGILRTKYSHSASFRVIQVRTTTGINLKQTESIEQFCQEIIHAMDNFCTDLCGEGLYANHIPIETLLYMFSLLDSTKLNSE